MSKFLESDIPFSSLVNPTPEKIERYQNLNEISRWKDDYVDMSGGYDALITTYHDTLTALENGDVSQAQLRFLEFAQAFQEGVDDMTFSPKHACFLLEHMMGLYAQQILENQSLKSENAGLKNQPQ